MKKWGSKILILNLSVFGFFLVLINYPLQEPGTNKKPVTQKPKYILYYSQFWSSDNFGHGYGMNPFVANNCSVNNCFITNNRSLLPEIEDFDMIIFYTGRGEVPKKRSPKQFYVYFSLEAPPQSGINGYAERYKSFFNLTMTYRRDSDIFLPYGELQSGDYVSTIKNKLKETSSRLTDDRKLVAWVVSHCETQSKREKYVQKMKNWIPIDQYGKCTAGGDCDNTCYMNLGTKYKFYLSFENSLCKDYVTEKLWRILEQDMIPVVLGSANYTDVAPPHSFINVQDFKSPEELAKYLLKLEKNQKVIFLTEGEEISQSPTGVHYVFA
ncbi:alpha-(1,3)-fucosyltransferase C [Eurytemora carolleeae]|uniref:alpha-(1,3)-fucosyltransferase C n=1 Tax=Eurytemora carolleeae TaxID=1294199 RepID=UPI000C76E531|nr:alpha-(1,3)-fucosyltransferase C [Eurytemora carolleeae]|eukprot:XP_023348411.1 alpha-(1,3)-fucosyltransferase C-like [Eurytemora affinis]